MTSRVIVGPFNRVEGDLEIRLDIEAGRVRDAFVTAPLFRDFEQLMLGRQALDALVIAPRICGICSVSQSVAALSALAAAGGQAMPGNGRLAINLMLGLENAADHLIHFALFFMPDFARAAYRGRPWFEMAHARFKAGDGVLAQAAAQARNKLFSAMGILAGKWPHSLALQPGGSTKPVDLAERARLRDLLQAFRRFLEGEIYGCSLEEVTAADRLSDLRTKLGGDAGRFLAIADDLDLWRLGRCDAALMSYGAFPDSFQGGHLFGPGIWQDGALRPLEAEAIREDTAHSWLAGDTPLHPAQGRTDPLIDKPDAYSWCKAPRLGGQPVEVGALARQCVAGQPLVAEAHLAFGSTVGSRVLARLVELARLVPAMESWTRLIEPGQNFCLPYPSGVAGQGVGMVEAARGSLGHWLGLEGGRIASYQVVSPTTWNFSPRDLTGTPGPVEAALRGTAVEPDQANPIAVQHIVRSFDPCMACTVH